jgi:Ni,Fe-hydrogenase III small subunit
MVWQTLARHLLTRPAARRGADQNTVAALSQRLRQTGTQKLGRSLAIRHVAAGSCNGCELELRATQNLVHDLMRYGLSFTASPRHADILLITGVAAKNMVEAVRQAREAMPDPVFVVAVGDCAVDGGVFKGSPAITGGADSILPVDLLIAGCPPTPGQIIEGLLALIEAHDPPALIMKEV